MKIIGHRGARGLAPENTIDSLKKAVELKVDEIEFDLRVTKDGVVILHHDPYMKDKLGNKLYVNKSDYSDLKNIKPGLTTLEKLLDTSEKVPLYLEAKPKINSDPIIKLLKSYPKSNFSIASKSIKTLTELHQALPNTPTIVIYPWSGVIATHRARKVGTKRISMNQLFLWSGFIKNMSRKGYKLSAYTLNNPKKAKRWEKYGLYAVVTDRPDLFRD